MDSTVVIGRGYELGVLEDSLAAAATGEPQVVLVEGEAGVGKSSLLRTFCADHPETRTLAWVGDELESHLPFATLDQLLASARTWEDPFAAGAALLSWLGELAVDGSVLVTLDDAHLTDQPSLVALNFALRRLRHDPVLSVFTARSSHVGALPRSILRMATEGDRRLALHGLGVSDVQAMAEAMGVEGISDGAAARLHAITEGIPLYLSALLSEVPSRILSALTGRYLLPIRLHSSSSPSSARHHPMRVRWPPRPRSSVTGARSMISSRCPGWIAMACYGRWMSSNGCE